MFTRWVRRRRAREIVLGSRTPDLARKVKDNYGENESELIGRWSDRRREDDRLDRLIEREEWHRLTNG